MSSLRYLTEAPRARVSRVRLTWGYALAVVGTVVVAAALQAFSADPLSLEPIILMLLVVATALVGGLAPAVLAAVLAGAALNLFFAPPYGTLIIADPTNAVTIVVFLLTGMAVATVVDQAAQTTAQAQRARAEADTLADLSRGLLRAGNSQQRLLVELCQTLGMNGATISKIQAGGVLVVDAEHGDVSARPPETSVSVAPGVSLRLHGRKLLPTDQTLLTAYVAHFAVLHEREQAAAESRRAAELAVTNRTRTALLAAVSHDLRTPLAGVKAAASSLRSTEVVWSPQDEGELLAAIEDGCDRLENLIDNLLDLSRLHMGAVNPLVTAIDIEEAVAWTLDTVPGADRIRVTVPEALPSALVDPGLLDRVLANLVENALRHTPIGTPITLKAECVSASQQEHRLLLRVIDHGGGVPTDREQNLFVPFQRLGDIPNGEGLGLGLAVARGLTEAMGGTVYAEPTPGGGLTMVINLPTADETSP